MNGGNTSRIRVVNMLRTASSLSSTGQTQQGSRNIRLRCLRTEWECDMRSKHSILNVIEWQDELDKRSCMLGVGLSKLQAKQALGTPESAEKGALY